MNHKTLLDFLQHFLQ